MAKSIKLKNDVYLDGGSINPKLDLFNDTSGNDWKDFLKNKIDFCIANINTNKQNAQTFINGGWQGVTYGFGIFSKVGTVYQLVWHSYIGTYYCRKNDDGTYVYNQLSSDDTGWNECVIDTDFQQTSWNKLRYRKRNNVVNIIGCVTVVNNPTSWGKTITTLPAGYRPVGEVDVVCRTTWSEVIKIVIDTSGNIFTLNLNDGRNLPVGEGILINITYIVD